MTLTLRAVSSPRPPPTVFEDLLAVQEDVSCLRDDVAGPDQLAGTIGGSGRPV
jgi:hypothetical protein